MTVFDKLSEHFGTQQKMADAVGCSQTLVWRWLHQKSQMPAHFAIKIEKLTHGKFKAVDLSPALAEIEKMELPQ